MSTAPRPWQTLHVPAGAKDHDRQVEAAQKDGYEVYDRSGKTTKLRRRTPAEKK